MSHYVVKTHGDGGHLVRALSPPPTTGTPYKIFLHIIEARGLISSDPNHMSDAICVLEIGPTLRERKSTSTQYHTMNAIWDEVFMFEGLTLQSHEFQNEKISLSVLHKSDFTRNKLIGNYEFSLGNIYRQKGHQYYRQWVPLAVPEKPENEDGWLLVSVYVLGPNDPTPIMEKPGSSSSSAGEESDESNIQILTTPNSGDKKMYVLNLLIYRAADVLITQYGGGVNFDTPSHIVPDIGVKPFVSVRFNGNVLQTTVAASDSADRTWNRRLELPFTLPLRSDSIEIILWNQRTGLQDQIIGVQSFNFFQMGLAHKSWGPRWINMYASDYVSPETSFLGKIKHYWGSEKTLQKHEYVGRILVRMSVAQTDEPLLLSVPCAPVLDPRGDDYTLQLLIHSASELPVLGGKVRAELVFGVHRVRSAWIFSRGGQSGVFDFHTQFAPISSHIPNDRTQVHHAFLNIYHKVGGRTYKIAYEKIPLLSLLPQNAEKSGGYWLNGSQRVSRNNKLPDWPCRWRTLTHVHPDSAKSHVTAGFLLCSFAFGLKKDFPIAENIPPPLPGKYVKYTLRCYIHLAGNLISALQNGCSNPLLAIRYAGRSILLPCQQKNTLFPLWFECTEITDAYLDILHAPSVYLMILHQTTFGYITLGRAEIATEHILQNQNMLCRYRVKYDQDRANADGGGGGKGGGGGGGGEDDGSSASSVPGASPEGSNSMPVNLSGFPILDGKLLQKRNLNDYLLSLNASKSLDDYAPYILGSFSLFPTKQSSSYPYDPAFPPVMKDYVVKLEAIGLRELEGVMCDKGTQYLLEVGVPKISFEQETGGTMETNGGASSSTDDGSSSSSSSTTPTPGPPRPLIKWDKQTPACSPLKGSGVQILNSCTFTRVALPQTDPYSFPLRIRVLNQKSRHVYCSRFIPIAELLDVPLNITRPPTYIYSAVSSSGAKSSSGDAIGSMNAGGAIGVGNSLAITVVGEETTGGEMENTVVNAATSSSSSATATSSSSSSTTSTAPGKPAVFTAAGKAIASASEVDDIPNDYKGLVLHVEDAPDNPIASSGGGGDDEPGGGGPSGPHGEVDDPFTLELDPTLMNVGPGTSSEEVKLTNEWRNDGAILPSPKEQEEGEGEEVKEEIDLTPKRPQLRVLSLFRNKSSHTISANNIVESCVLKVYIRCRPLPPKVRDADKAIAELDKDSMLQPIKPLYEKSYMARCYVYTGINLAPLNHSLLESYSSSTPYLIASNGIGSNHRVTYESKKKPDTLNPEFFQVFDLATRIPDHYKLEIQIWNSGLIKDDLIGSVWIDLETRLLQQLESKRLAEEEGEEVFQSTTEYHDLKNTTSRISQGKLSMKLELLTEEEARRTKPEDYAPTVSEEYELRMVIWQTRDVRFPIAENADGAIDDVNQRVAVTTNFTFQHGRELTKTTDVAWNSGGGHADWFYRMKWRLKLPAKLPRLKIAMWNETVMSSNLLIGECLYNLNPFLQKALRDKQNSTFKTEQEWISFVHPLYSGLNLGAALIEFSLLTQTEADKNPVGEAQNEPNRDPFLRDPKRNPPPWAYGTKGLNALGRLKKLIMIIIIVILVLGVGVALIFPLTQVV